MTEAGAARAYSSPLRAEQAEQTRARIVQAAVDLLAEGTGDLSMGDVAVCAGVSVRTVYRSFATKDDLLDGVIEWINRRINQVAGTPPETRAHYESTTADVIGVVFELEPLYRALFATAAGRETHRRSNVPTRQESMRRAYAAELEGLDDGQARRLLAVLHTVASSNGALFMNDYWDLSPDEVGQAIEWAIRVLADAASNPDQREGL